MLIFSKEIRAGTALFNGAILDEFNKQISSKAPY